MKKQNRFIIDVSDLFIMINNNKANVLNIIDLFAWMFHKSSERMEIVYRIVELK